jgi:1,4-alpha-glucan branching enzyme
MHQMDVVVMLHSHLPYVLHHGRWPHGSDWICEAAIDSYLPLLEMLRDLDAGNVAAPLTVSLTPVLANQLAHPAFAAELGAYFDQRLAACDEAAASLHNGADDHLASLVDFWRSRLVRLRLLFHEIGGNIPGEFRRLQDGERIEVATSAATHAFLPLLGRDESIRLQLALGAREHRRVFGSTASGCWLPECAYRPAGEWRPLAGVPARHRTGLETHVAAAGFRYVVADTHMARAGSPLGVYGELFGGEAEHVAGDGRPFVASNSPYTTYRIHDVADHALAALVRDPRSSMQVWSRHGGYPGAAPYLEFHKIRWPGGLRLWRVSAPGSGLGDKEPYDPLAARHAAAAHAGHFLGLLDRIAGEHAVSGGDVIVAPFDTELFGHWWFEGPDFLREVYARLPSCRGLRASTAAGHLDARMPRQALRLAPGSWGRDGDFSMWLNARVEWTWPVIWDIEDRFWSLAPRALAEPHAHAVLAQVAREMLLLQSSDWQFIMSTGEVEDYAIRRFNGHAADAARLMDALASALDGGDMDGSIRLANELRERDDVFPDIIPSIAAALEADTSRAVSVIV